MATLPKILIGNFKINLMKYIYFSLVSLILLSLVSCEDDYKLSTKFSVPTELSSPESVTLNVNSSDNIILSWTGGGAADGSYVIYEVQFDKEGGDFSAPLFKSMGDYGVDPKLTMSQATLNSIARKAGIKPDETGNVIWTVTASKGGDVETSGLIKTIKLTRGEGIDNIPEQLYLDGAATENGGTSGLPFRKADDGVFIIYTKVGDSGTLNLKNGTGEDAIQYYAEDGKLKEGTGTFTIPANVNPYRITVDYNTLSLKTEVISNVRTIWGATYDVIGNLTYSGNGKFKADNCKVIFIKPDRPETNPPGWLSWTEDRYYFIAKIDGVDKCWGRKDGVSAENPSANEPASFYEIGEFEWSQWDHLWKMSLSLDMKKCTITIDTNNKDVMIHQFSNITPL